MHSLHLYFGFCFLTYYPPSPVSHITGRKVHQAFLNSGIFAGSLRFCDYLSTLVSVETTLMLKGLFIIPRTSWIKVGVIILSLNIHEAGTWGKVRETDRQSYKQHDKCNLWENNVHTVTENILIMWPIDYRNGVFYQGISCEQDPMMQRLSICSFWKQPFTALKWNVIGNLN